MPLHVNMLNCRICGNPATDPAKWRCDEHYRCDDCGDTAENLLYLTEGLLCDDCHQARIKKQIAEFDGDTDFTDDPTCPHCGHEHETTDMHDGGEYECEFCGNAFELEVHVFTEYSTTKVSS